MLHDWGVIAAAFGYIGFLFFVASYGDRISLLHVKDMVVKPGAEPHSTELGHGDIDYAPIFAAATHVRHYFYEQEEFDMDPIKAIRISAAYLNHLKA